MTHHTVFTALVGASVLAATALAGCSSKDDHDPYATEQAEPASQPSSTANAPETRPMERSVAAERSQGMSQGAGTTMPGEMADFAESDVVGHAVVSQDGKEIGKIAMLVDDANGESKFAVVEVGEFLGIGEKQVAIDTRHLSLTADGKVQSNVTADALKSMPEYKTADYEDEPEEQDE